MSSLVSILLSLHALYFCGWTLPVKWIFLKCVELTSRFKGPATEGGGAPGGGGGGAAAPGRGEAVPGREEEEDLETGGGGGGAAAPGRGAAAPGRGGGEDLQEQEEEELQDYESQNGMLLHIDLSVSKIPFFK